MKKLVLIFFVFLFCVCTAQINKAKQDVEIIKVKKYNIEKEINNGSLSFLKGCFFTETKHANGKIISKTWANPNILIGRRGVIYIENIKKQNPDGSTQLIPPKKIVIE